MFKNTLSFFLKAVFKVYLFIYLFVCFLLHLKPLPKQSQDSEDLFYSNVYIIYYHVILKLLFWVNLVYCNEFFLSFSHSTTPTKCPSSAMLIRYSMLKL